MDVFLSIGFSKRKKGAFPKKVTFILFKESDPGVGT